MTDGAGHEVLTAELAAAEARQLLSEVARVGEIRAVREAAGRASPASPGLAPQDLAAAGERLLGGATRRLQVHYRHDAADWIDTYLATSSGFRLVRVRAPETGRVAGSGD